MIRLLSRRSTQIHRSIFAATIQCSTRTSTPIFSRDLSSSQHNTRLSPFSQVNQSALHLYRRYSAISLDNMSGISLGFYGGGMMAEAIVRGLLTKKVLLPPQICICEIVEARRNLLSKLGVRVTSNPEELLSGANVVILAVKPDAVPGVLATITKQENMHPDQERLLISICAGVTLEALAAGNSQRNCVRVMPNQPCLVGEAASAFALSKTCTDAHREVVDTLMGACGLSVELPEKNLDAVTGLSGSGPGYVYMMIEALADGGVQKGLPRMVARKLAAQTVFGAAKMALEAPDVHPGELRNRVESPGGTTVVGTAALEEAGFRAAVIEAVVTATERSEELGKK